MLLRFIKASHSEKASHNYHKKSHNLKMQVIVASVGYTFLMGL